MWGGTYGRTATATGVPDDDLRTSQGPPARQMDLHPTLIALRGTAAPQNT
jgi:hypothetical protein